MLKQIAWNTFKNTGNINTFMELMEVDKAIKDANEKNLIDNKGIYTNEKNLIDNKEIYANRNRKIKEWEL